MLHFENNMTGTFLVSMDNFYATNDNKVDWGPKADKDWVYNLIKDKVVFVGQATWECIKEYERLVNAPKEWVIGEPTEACEIHFGGYRSLVKYPPKKLILHRAKEVYLETGKKFNWTYLAYTCVEVNVFPDYLEEIYEKKK